MRTIAATFFLIVSGLALASTTFTYQGQLQDTDGPVNDTVVMEFFLYDSETATSSIASDGPVPVTVSDGLFQAELDFGQQSYADTLWLEIVIDNGTPLPRQPIYGVPLALDVADGAVSTSSIEAGSIGTTQIDSSQVQERVTGTCASPTAVRAINADGSVNCSPPFWSTSGNALSGGEFIGTTNNQPFEIRTNASRHLRIEPAVKSSGVPALLDGEVFTANIIAGSSANSVEPGVRGATISGGGVPSDITAELVLPSEGPNQIFDHYSVIGGGYNNIAGSDDDVLVTARFSTVSGGLLNRAKAANATVGGGVENTASGSDATVGGGDTNTASGLKATVPGGSDNCAGGLASLAMGSRAKVRPGSEPGDLACNGLSSYSGDTDGDNGTFVWADDQESDFVSDGARRFLVRAQNGAEFVTESGGLRVTSDGPGVFNAALRAESFNDGGIAINADNDSTDATLVLNNRGLGPLIGGFARGSGKVLDMQGDGDLIIGGTLSENSDRNSKSDIDPVDPASILDKVATLPISTWRYKDDRERNRHMGPMAQDFHAAFGLGGSETTLAGMDVRGVALAAIQGLHDRNQTLADEVDTLEKRNRALAQKLAALSQRLDSQQQATAERLAALEKLITGQEQLARSE